MDSAQHCNSFSMSTLRNALPTTEESQFRQAIQCTTCLNPRLSEVECTLRSHCPICHYRAHTVNQSEYNMLNRAAAPARHVKPQNDRFQQRQDERSHQPTRFQTPSDLSTSNSFDQVRTSIATTIGTITTATRTTSLATDKTHG